MIKFLTSVEKETLDEFDLIRGRIPRSAYIRGMIENEVAAVNAVRQDKRVHGDCTDSHGKCGAVHGV